MSNSGMVLDVPLMFLNLLGQHPLKQDALAKLRFTVITVIGLCGNVLVFCMFLFNITEIEKMADSLGIVPLLYQTMAKTFILSANYSNLKKILKRLDLFWTLDTPGKFLPIEIENTQKFTKKLINGLKIMIFVTAYVHMLQPLFLSAKQLPVEWLNFCNVSTSPCYELNYMYQINNATVIAITNIGFDGMFVAFINYAYCELMIIKQGFEHLEVGEKEKDPELLKTFHKLVEQHGMVIKFIKSLNQLYSLLLLNQFWATMFTNCVQLFTISSNGFSSNPQATFRCLLYVIAFTFEFGVFCTGGQLILDQSISVVDSVYNSNWTSRYQPHIWRGMVMVIQRAQIAEKLTVGGFHDLNLETFKNALRNSMTFFTVMQSVYSPATK